MKAISLWQPWASAMALGSKTIETRHWPTNVRGPVAIHAAQRKVKNELDFLGYCVEWKGALAPYLHEDLNDYSFLLDLPFGAIVAVGHLADCLPVELIDEEGDYDLDKNHFAEARYVRNKEMRVVCRWQERQMGDYSCGRFGWIFSGVFPLREAIPFKGKQGFFEVPDELLEGKY